MNSRSLRNSRLHHRSLVGRVFYRVIPFFSHSSKKKKKRRFLKKRKGESEKRDKSGFAHLLSKVPIWSCFICCLSPLFFFFLSPSLILSLCLPSSPHFHKNTPSAEHLRRSCDGTRIRHRKCCCAPLELQRYGYPARRVPKSNNTMHKKLGTRGGGNTKYREKKDESSAKAKNKQQPIVRDTEKAKQKRNGKLMPKKKNSQRKAASLPFFFSFLCVCVCNIVSSMRHEWQHLPLFTTYSTNSTNNERSWGVPPRCVRVYNKCEKKKRDGRCFFAFLFEYVASARSLLVLCFFFFTVSSFNSLYLVQCFALFFFFSQVCAEKHCSGSQLVVMQF